MDGAKSAKCGVILFSALVRQVVLELPLPAVSDTVFWIFEHLDYDILKSSQGSSIGFGL